MAEFFWRNFFGGIFLEDFFWEDFFGRIFLGGLFRRNFFGRIIWEEFFGRNSLFTLELTCLSRFGFLSRFCLNGEEEEEGKNLDP